MSEMTGQTISAMGVWNVIQALGEKVCEDEKVLIEEHKKGNVTGEKEVPVLFEEADGVYLKLQGKDRKKAKQDKAEMKVGIAYDGWRKTGPVPLCPGKQSGSCRIFKSKRISGIP